MKSQCCHVKFGKTVYSLLNMKQPVTLLQVMYIIYSTRTAAQLRAKWKSRQTPGNVIRSHSCHSKVKRKPSLQLNRPPSKGLITKIRFYYVCLESQKTEGFSLWKFSLWNRSAVLSWPAHTYLEAACVSTPRDFSCTEKPQRTPNPEQNVPNQHLETVETGAAIKAQVDPVWNAMNRKSPSTLPGPAAKRSAARPTAVKSQLPGKQRRE